jgi:NitT/TauT family transport system substrate-binding protein
MTPPVRVVLEYLHPWTNSAGFFVASQQGWYRDAGLDVELSVVDPSRGDSLAYLARHEAAFAVFPTNRLFVRRSRNEPLVGIAAVNHRAMETIHTLRATGITRPRDLEGRRISLNPTPRGVAMVRHLVAADGGDPDGVVVVDSGLRELGAAEIVAGEVDATFGNYWAWDVLISPVPADEQLYWPVDEIGAPRYHSYLLGAHETTLERNPEMVRRFLAITARGYLTAVAEPRLALTAFETYLAYFPRPLLRESLARISTTWVHDGQWGRQREELHAPYAEWLASVGILPDASVWRAATTNELLADVAPYDGLLAAP